MTTRTTPTQPIPTSTSFHPFRLHPGADLKLSLQHITSLLDLRAGFISTAVGSLTSLHIRLAHDPLTKHNDTLQIPTSENRCFEITSLVGTLSMEGMHIHLCVSDSGGKMIGGHLLEGCTVFTTCEIVVGVLEDVMFVRPVDEETGCDELKITKRRMRDSIDGVADD